MTTKTFNKNRCSKWLKVFNKNKSRVFLMVGMKEDGLFSFVFDESQDADEIASNLESLAKLVKLKLYDNE